MGRNPVYALNKKRAQADIWILQGCKDGDEFYKDGDEFYKDGDEFYKDGDEFYKDGVDACENGFGGNDCHTGKGDQWC